MSSTQTYDDQLHQKGFNVSHWAPLTLRFNGSSAPRTREVDLPPAARHTIDSTSPFLFSCWRSLRKADVDIPRLARLYQLSTHEATLSRTLKPCYLAVIRAVLLFNVFFAQCTCTMIPVLRFLLSWPHCRGGATDRCLNMSCK